MNKEIILTLDAGGTNFVFSAMQDYREIITPFSFPSNADNLNLCLQTIIDGFTRAINLTQSQPSAISFAFPGPADYERGVIGKLNNLPAFKGGVALGPLLEDKFKIPVFINNDGDLFAYGESLHGFLPFINEELRKRKRSKNFRNLIGVTLGTGFGAGIVVNNNLLLGDNSNGAEIWLMRDGLNCGQNVEESISARGVRGEYALRAGSPFDASPTPEEIFHIAIGKAEGNVQAAGNSFVIFGKCLGEALANAVTLIDGVVVIGGGLARAHKLFMPSLIEQMNSFYNLSGNNNLNRLLQRTFPAVSESEIDNFCDFSEVEAEVPFTRRKVLYHSDKRICVGVSRLGTSRAIAIGAYQFASDKLNELTVR